MRAASRVRQAGFSLIELMVALAIGLIVSLAVMMGYLGAAQSQRGQTDVTRMQETARFTFDLFGRESRHAAFRNNVVYSASTGTQTFGTSTGSDTFLAGTNDASSPTLPDGSTPTVINNGDVITFRYYGMDGATAGTADGTILNCMGTGIKYGQINEDTLYIALDTSNTTNSSAGEPTLYCASRQKTSGAWASSTGSPIALIPGVESMQILYGEDTDSDGIVNHYVKADALSSSDFTKVVAIMVSVVVRSPSASGFSAAQVLNHFGTDYAAGGTAPSGDAGSVFTAPTDGRLRRIYSTVFALRNTL
jgi:type IV pilus assembly protein PilW